MSGLDDAQKPSVGISNSSNDYGDVTEPTSAVGNQIQLEDLNNRIQNRKLRLKFSYKIYNLMICYLAYVAVIIYLNAVEEVPLYISDNVIITMLGTTTATVVGLFYVVANYFFPKNGD